MVTTFDLFYMSLEKHNKDVDTHLDVNRVIFTVNFLLLIFYDGIGKGEEGVSFKEREENPRVV